MNKNGIIDFWYVHCVRNAMVPYGGPNGDDVR